MERSNEKIDNLTFVTGDATNPIGDGKKVIVHICNDIGKWGRGFVLAISKRWPQPEKEYKAAFTTKPAPLLGTVQFIAVSDDITVANMIGQHGIKTQRTAQKAKPPIRYEAVKECLKQVAAYAIENKATLHMPRIGCGLAGGKWDKIQAIIIETLCKKGIAVVVYDFK